VIDRTLLITVSGIDAPGLTSAIFEALAPSPVIVIDMEQLVVRGHLTLAIAVEIDATVLDPDAPAVLDSVRKSVRLAAGARNMEVTTRPVATLDIGHSPEKFQVIVMCSPLHPECISIVTSTIAEQGGNLDRIHRIADYPVTAIRLEGSGVAPSALRRPLAAVSARCHVDISVQDVALEARGQYLVVLDVDSTLIQEEVVDLLGELAGVGTQVSEITRAAMNGELDFAQSLMARVALLAGSPAHLLDQVREMVTLTPGARTLCRTLNRLGYRIVLVSGGFTNVIEPIAKDLGVSAFRANTLEIIDGKLTGKLVGQIIDREGKRQALIDFATEFNIPNRRTIAIGDGANDIDMISEAGLGVAFNAKLALRESADTTVNVPYLDSVLYLLGITRDEIVRSDREKTV
jgi:phosphoserine phosphatase